MDKLLHFFAGLDSLRVGWSLIHLLWQGLVIAILLEAALFIAGRRNASLRYVLCALALAAMPVCVVDTYLFLGSDSAAAIVSTVSAATTVPHETASRQIPAHFTWQPVVNSIADFTSREMLSFDLNRWLPGMVAGWLVGVVLLALRKAGGLVLLSHWRRHEVYAPTEAMCELCRQACAKIGVNPRRVYLGISNLIEVPMTMGWVRPLILFPANLLTGLSIEEIELLLAHELAHIRRCDYLINLVQVAVETVFFYHPCTWWISRRMRQERENSCDDLVATRSHDVAAYAHALFHVQTLRLSNDFTLAPAANGGSLLLRIERLAGEPARKPAPGAFAFLAFLVAAGFLVACGPMSRAGFSVMDIFSRNGGSNPLLSGDWPTAGAPWETVYQDNFRRVGELDGSSPGVVNKTGATWKSSTGGNQYRASGHEAEISTSAYAYSLAYLPVNGTSGVSLDGTKDFTLSVVVNPGPTGRAGISLNTGPMERYSNLYTNSFATLSTCRAYAGAYDFGGNGSNIQYSFAPGTRGPTRISLAYRAEAKTLTYQVGDTVLFVKSGVRAEQVAAIRCIALGNDGYNAAEAPPAPRGSPTPKFDDFAFTIGDLRTDSAAVASASAQPRPPVFFGLKMPY